jgi:hypothetical protein
MHLSGNYDKSDDGWNELLLEDFENPMQDLRMIIWSDESKQVIDGSLKPRRRKTVPSACTERIPKLGADNAMQGN